MDYPDNIFASGPQASQNVRRMSDPGQFFIQKAAVANRRMSDPGSGSSVFTLREALRPMQSKGSGNGHRLSYAETSSASQSFVSLDQDSAPPADADASSHPPVAVPHDARAWRRDTLRPRADTQQSVYSGSDGRRVSYAETSSAAQSFWSLDSGPVDTPTHSTLALSTAASDAEHGGPARPRHESPPRNTTVRSQATAPLRPRQAQAASGALHPPTPSFAPQASDTPDVNSAAERDAADAPQDPPVPTSQVGSRAPRRYTAKRAPAEVANAGQHPAALAVERDAADGAPNPPVPASEVASGARRPRRYSGKRVPVEAANAGQHLTTPAGARDAADGPQDPPVPPSKAVSGVGPRRYAGARASLEAADGDQRRAPQDAGKPPPAQGSHAPAESDPRRSFKVSETPTVVQSQAPAFRGDEHARAQPPILEPRRRLPSGASNRSGGATAPSASPSKPAFHPRQDERAAAAQPSSRPSGSAERPNAPSGGAARAPAPASAATRAEKPAAEAISAVGSRPPLPTSGSQMDTKYVNMLLAVDSIPPLYNLLASFFTWILLAGFVLFPGTFTNLQQNNELGAIGVTATNVIKHVSLFVVAWVCTAIGAAGMCWLWYRWQANYIWLVNRIFMPGFLNSLAGVLSTLSSVLGTQNATLSKSSKSTIIVTSSIAGVCGILSALYMFVLIRRLKKQHDQEVGKQRSGKHGEGVTDLSKRKLGARLV